jgi:ribosomal protein S11
MEMAISNEQLAQRQNYFRQANERIEYAAAMAAHTGQRPFICECSLDGCVEHIEVEAAAYDAVRGHAARFFTRVGHEIAEIEDVVERNATYQVVEKTTHYAEIAASGNPRS